MDSRYWVLVYKNNWYRYHESKNYRTNLFITALIIGLVCRINNEVVEIRGNHWHWVL